MTLSNFDWTDKDSVKWFVLLPTGHEGPYALKALIQLQEKNQISGDVSIWSEGMVRPIPLKEVLSFSEVDLVPDLPPLPEEEIPPLPVTEDVQEQKGHKRKFIWPFIIGIMLLMTFFALSGFIKGQEKFEIRRYPKMTLELHQRILKEFSFGGWEKKIFFKEYLPADQSYVWLVTASYQSCQVEASFQSIPGKLLAMEDESISFKTKGVLKNHVVEFSTFEFSKGNKIVPGLYEMDVKASQCDWDGFLPRLMNKFSPPDESYEGRTKVVLFSKGAESFNQILDRLIKKKMEIALKEQSSRDLFWDGLQQKLETLQAITIQVEQLLLDFLESGNNNFRKRLSPMVEEYTRKFGSFLTSFVVENEKYFQSLSGKETQGSSQVRNYELMVKLTSKNIGFESMKFIEELQSIKGKPKNSDLKKIAKRAKETYAQIKNDISRKIIQVSEDRSK